MTCIKIGSDESHFNVSVIVRDDVTNHNFWREMRAEAVWNRGPSAYQPNALPLGQTGSHDDDEDEVLLNVLRCQLTY